jgi:hypothetical protein
METKNILPNITEDQYRIIITALHTLEEQYPKDNRIPELTDLISTQTFEVVQRQSLYQRICQRQRASIV